MSITADPLGPSSRPAAETVDLSSTKVAEIDWPRGRPVLYWFTFGVASTALLTYVITSWMLSDDFDPAPKGSDELNDTERFGMWFLQITFPLMALIVTAVIVRRCLRERRFTWDAKLQVACVLMFWLDPVPNFLKPQVFFNSHYVNMGSWVEQIPGWVSPNGANLPNSLLVEMPIFFLLILGVWVGCGVMGLLHKHFPRLNTFGLLFGAWLWMSIFTMLLEYPLIRLGWLAWNGTIHDLSIDGGNRMQMPLTECWLVGGWLTAISALRFFRDDRGRSAVERGLERVHGTPKMKQLVSTFAIIGYCQMSFMAYNVITIPLALYDDPTPAGYKSFMVNELCDPGSLDDPCTGEPESVIRSKIDR